MSDVTPVIYVKPGCPWCEEVLDYFTAHRLPFKRLDVTSNPLALQAMRKLSGQSKAPTMDWDGEILADFGVDELIPFLAERGLV
jgi:glutaredoxin 3